MEVTAGKSAVRATVRESTPMEPIAMRDVVPRTEVPKMHWKTLQFGKLRLSPGPSRLTVRAVSKPGAVVMDLNRVLLKHVA